MRDLMVFSGEYWEVRTCVQNFCRRIRANEHLRLESPVFCDKYKNVECELTRSPRQKITPEK